MKRLLCIVDVMDKGGAETFLMKILRNIDKEKYILDFVVSSPNKGFYDDEIKSMGGRIYRICPKTKNPIRNIKDIYTIVKKNNYKNVMRISRHSISSVELLVAKVAGANKLIFRSSNTNSGDGSLADILHKLFKPVLNRIANIKIAPSSEAGYFMFGYNEKFHLLNNGLDVDLYSFNNNIRQEYRKALNVQDKFVVGHIGRFSEQKNHKFLIDIFEEIHKDQPKSVLVMIGKGEKLNMVKEKIREKSLTDSVIFLGVRDDISEILSSMDVFLFPSFYEGMPNTLIEAQASGLKSIVSDTITKEANITDLVTYYSLEKTPTQWAKIVMEKNKKMKDSERDKYKYEVKKAGYDINDVAKEFINIVFEG